MSTGPLLIDLDGVVRLWDAPSLSEVEERFGLPSGGIGLIAFGPALLHQAVTGLITDGEWRARIGRAVEKEYGSAGKRALEEWSSGAGRVDYEVLQLLRQLRVSRRIALVTNATSRLPHDLDRLKLLDEFDAVFNSSELGVAKPDPGFFRKVFGGLSCMANDCLFVDDTAGNIAAATDLGLTTHLYRSLTGLIAFLESASGA